MERKLASVRRIAALDPIEGADRIVRATVDGWQLVTAKENGFNVGDLVVYFEIDSFLPVQEEYEFLRKGCFKSTKNLGDGFRIKTIKLRGQVSQGLILPLTIIKTEAPLESFQEGDDLTELLGVQKYEKPIPSNLVGKVRGNFPSFIRKTDQERAQNLTRYLPTHLDHAFEVTMKLDGSSMTVYYKDGVTGVCSRNYDLDEEIEEGQWKSVFWRVARQKKLLDTLAAYCVKFNRNLALQGELMGPGVQGNREELKENEFFLFDIWDINEERYLLPLERGTVLVELDRLSNELNTPLIRKVPRMNDGILRHLIKDNPNIVEGLLQFAEGPSLNENKTREGLVFRGIEYDFSFKVISNKFLLEEKD